MSIRKVWLGCLWALLAAGGLNAQDKGAVEHAAPAQEPAPAQQMEAPTLEWVPGPMLPAQPEAVPGRVASHSVGVAFTLPEAWRTEDVAWRELTLADAQAIWPQAEAGVVVELREGREAQRLLTVYRAPLDRWREADRSGKAGPGRVTITTPDKAYVVVRGDEAAKPGRYADLRATLEDAVGTLSLYDAYRENRQLGAEVGSDFAGALVGGEAVKLHLEAGGELTLTVGADRSFSGKWQQRGATIIGHLVGTGEGVNPALLFHFDAGALIAMRWDAGVFGNTGVRLEKAK